jgi:hypothetical protein
MQTILELLYKIAAAHSYHKEVQPCYGIGSGLQNLTISSLEAFINNRSDLYVLLRSSSGKARPLLSSLQPRLNAYRRLCGWVPGWVLP